MSVAALSPLPALFLAACAAIAVSGCSVSIGLDDAERRTEIDLVDPDGIVALDVETGNGRVEVIGADVDEIEVRSLIVETDEGDAEYSVRRDGDRLVVVGDCDGGWLDPCSVGFRITAPADLDVAIDTSNGRIDVDGMTGELDVETDNGAIDVGGAGAVTARAETDNGRVELAFEGTPELVVASSDNGAITVRVPDAAAFAVDADSDHGAVEVDERTDPDADHRIDATTDNGAITVQYTD